MSMDEVVIATSLAAMAKGSSDTDCGADPDVDEPTNYADSDDHL
jgi:hypothetical protein